MKNYRDRLLAYKQMLEWEFARVNSVLEEGCEEEFVNKFDDPYSRRQLYIAHLDKRNVHAPKLVQRKPGAAYQRDKKYGLVRL